MTRTVKMYDVSFVVADVDIALRGHVRPVFGLADVD